jgi:hypothetical protein
VRTVLGLSKTSTSIGWVLVDRRDAAGDPLDHDAFDIVNSSVAAPAATACRVRDIATASGYTVDSVHVTTSGNPSALREALAESGFDNIVSVPLAEATKAWATCAAADHHQEETAVCILGRDSASLSIIDTSSGAMRASTMTAVSDNVGLITWLNAALGVDDSGPDVLYLLGSRARLDAAAGALDAGLPIRVVATRDAQLALARGAALSSVTLDDHVVSGRRQQLVASARTLTVVGAIAVVSLFTLSSADGPIPVAESSIAQPAPQVGQFAPDPAPPSTAMLGLPPSAAPPPMPQASPLPAVPQASRVPNDAVPQAVPVITPQAGDVSQPSERLPEPPPVQHLPDAQVPAAPGPAGPDTVAPVYAPPPPAEPPAQDPTPLSPLFGALP